MNGGGSPRDTVFKFDARTFADLGSIPVVFDDHRAIGVWTDGSIFLATWDGVIRRYSAAGALLDSLTVSGANFSDLDIAADGTIALGTGFDGDVVITDLSLDTFDRFQVTDSEVGGDVFVAWVAPPIPEPMSLAVLSLGGLVLFQRRSKRAWPG